MNTPKISVILPVYNAELYVIESIQSILDQSFSDFELIVINDGSTDESEKVILEFQDERIKYVKNEKNLKLITTLNLGLKLATGKYIARIDADDICFVDRFEKQYYFLESNPDFGLVGSFAEIIGSKNEIIKYSEEDEDIRFALTTHNPFIHSTVMFRHTILIDNNLKYRKDQLHVEDYDLWVNLLKFTKGKILPEVLVKYRIHDDQISSKFIIHQLVNSRNIQNNYLKENLSANDNLLIYFFLDDKNSFSVQELLFLGTTIMNDRKIKNHFEQRFYSSCLRKVKVQIYDSKAFSFNLLMQLIFNFKLFTFKQKCYFCLKFIGVK